MSLVECMGLVNTTTLGHDSSQFDFDLGLVWRLGVFLLILFLYLEGLFSFLCNSHLFPQKLHIVTQFLDLDIQLVKDHEYLTGSSIVLSHWLLILITFSSLISLFFSYLDIRCLVMHSLCWFLFFLFILGLIIYINTV